MSTKRPSPLPPFRPSPKKPRPPDTHREFEKRLRKKTTLKANTPEKLIWPPIPSLMSLIQQLHALSTLISPTIPSLTNTLRLTNKIPELHQLAHDTSLHLSCITETWLTSEIPDGELLIPGFNLYRTNSSCGRADGVGVYVSRLISPPLFTHPILPATIYRLNLKFSLGTIDCLLLVVVYCSPSSDVSDDLALLEFLRDVRELSITHFLIVGDFNAPLNDWSSLLSTDQILGCKLLVLSSELNWTQHVTQPARFRVRQNPSVFGLTFTNEARFVDQIEFVLPSWEK